MIKALVDGVWHNEFQDTETVQVNSRTGKWCSFRNRVTANGSYGFKSEPNRYHLYISYACPWAHRTVLYRKLKRLEDVISMSVLHPKWAGPNGWEFGETALSTVDHANAKEYLYQIYQSAKPDFTGLVTVPVLWDRYKGTIVNNESGEIIRMLNGEFDAWGDPAVDFYPAPLRKEIDRMNTRILGPVCSGVYAAGFAATQTAYDIAVTELFAALDELESILTKRAYLLGNQLTECDWHLFATLCRFDTVYHGALRCSLRRLIDYRALTAYTRRIYELPGVSETVKFDHIKRHYYDDIKEINHEIVPAGPIIDFRNATTH